MKNLNLKIVTEAIFLTIASRSCSKHFDDEDYTTDAKSKTSLTSKSLKVSSKHHNET